MLFSENKGKNQNNLLHKLDSYNEDLQYVGSSRSPHRKQMLIPLGTQIYSQNLEVSQNDE